MGMQTIAVINGTLTTEVDPIFVDESIGEVVFDFYNTSYYDKNSEYFNSAYEIYALFCVIATAGLPVALSVLISQAIAKGEAWRVWRIYRAAMTVFLWLGYYVYVLPSATNSKNISVCCYAKVEGKTEIV